MNDLKHACCSAAGVDPDSRQAGIIERAANLANDWYTANPMPCGTAAIADQHHHACKAHVSSEIRMSCGIVVWLSILSALLSICYTVWSWRHTIERDRQADAEKLKP